jgi:hypothetical protein
MNRRDLTYALMRRRAEAKRLEEQKRKERQQEQQPSNDGARQAKERPRQLGE